MASPISTLILSLIIAFLVSFVFRYFFPEMFDFFSSIFGRASAAPSNKLVSQLSTLDTLVSCISTFISTLISSTIISSIFSFMVVHLFPKMFESFLSNMFDYAFPKMFDYFFSTFRKATQDAPAIRLATEKIMASEGQQSTLDQVWGCLIGEPEVEIIGLHGTGGVGKTTLLKQINNKFCEESKGFEVVIWVVVSNKLSVEKIQEEIGRRIGFSKESWKNRSHEAKAQDISNTLVKKKFALLLDDLWNWIDLTEMGVPLETLKCTGSKIVFTTRKQDVCDRMKSRKFEVKCLDDNEAWKLFQETVGNDTLSSPPIVEQARIMCRECDGLPIALLVIGRAMSSKRTRQEWELAIQDLKTLSSEISGMEEKVYCRLKFSYDSLSTNTVRSCFVYCSLFPKDWMISKTNLLDCWVGEGFVDVYDRGFSIIGELVHACLLEEEDYDYVKMHNVIRDVALWIAKTEKENFLVEAGVGLTKSPEVEMWEGIKRLSLMDNQIESLPVPNCPDLMTLFLNNNDLREITDDFFQSMSSLKVLGLSKNIGMEKLPLRISNLVSLQYLDLHWTDICELPEALRALVNLKCLKAEYTRYLWTIPKQLISEFRKLQVLRLAGCDRFNKAEEDSVLYGGSELLVEELFHLKKLNALSLTLKSFHALEIFLSSKKLKSCTQSLFLEYFKESVTLDVPFLKDMKNLETLFIHWCDSLKFLEIDFTDKISIEIHGFHSIQTVVIGRCSDLRDLTWLILAPNLKRIWISYCHNMDEIISVKKLGEFQKTSGNLNPFEKLQFLELEHMLGLQSIYPNALPFPHLSKLCVKVCPKLKKLPLDSNSAKNSPINIYGEKYWWKKLQWEDEPTQNLFLPCYKGSYL